jgi:hypothetical protein
MRISSRKYLAAAKGQPCSLRIVGVCNGDPETTVPAHILDRHAGRGIKASDISVADACSSCHAKFDGQAGEPLSHEDWLFYALRGLQETLENRIERGIIFVPIEVPKPFAARPTKPRAPKAERKPVAQRENAWLPKGSRKIPTRKTLESRQ